MSLRICQIGQESFAAEPKMTTSKRMSSLLDGSVLGSAVKSVHHHFFSSRCSSEYLKTKATQTDYRESECQTLPWEPPYKVAEGHDPEVLWLRSFTWGDGLPAGAHEVEIINRMRMRRAWEKVLPPMDTPCNVKKRTVIITALEADEWAFREAEIQTIMDLRMELAEELMRTKDRQKKEKSESRFEKLDGMLKKRKQKEIKNIKNRLSRELRKLVNRHNNRNRGTSLATTTLRRAKRDSIDNQALSVDDDDNYSTIYRDVRPRYEANCGVEELRNEEKQRVYDDFNQAREENDKEVKCPKWLSERSNHRTRRNSGICRRYAERSEKQLLKLTRIMEDSPDFVRLSGPCDLVRRKEKLPSLPSTPRLGTPASEDNAEEERVDAAAELLRLLMNGRAVQSEFIEGKNRCIELIEELQATEKLEECEYSRLAELFRKKQQQKEEERRAARENKVTEVMQQLENKSVVKILTFLNDELTRLENEKKNHALVLLAERERMQKKIDQACQEQVEKNRRRELDEMYRQILKVNQDCVQTYLEDIVKEGIEWASDKAAENYVHEFADKIDAMAKYMDENMDKIEEEGMIADMVYNFVLPQVARGQERSSEKEEANYLRAARASIYDEMLGIAENELFDSLDRTSCCSNVEREVSCDSNDQMEAIKVEEKTGDALPRVIELILDYTSVSDEDHKQEIYIILEEMLGVAKEKLMILN